MSDFKTFLHTSVAHNQPVFLDGGMGTVIFDSGISGFTVPEELNFSHPELIKSIHRRYLEAGAQIITANSFGATSIKMHGCAVSAPEAAAQAIKLAKESIAEFEAHAVTPDSSASDNSTLDNNTPDNNTPGSSTQGSSTPDNSTPGAVTDPPLPCTGITTAHRKQHFAAFDMSSTGHLIAPLGDLSFDDAYHAFAEAAAAAEKAGADLALIETMSDLYEAKAAILAVREHTSLPIVATMTFQPNLRTLTGADVLTCVTYLEALKVDALGFNCGGALAEDAQLAAQFCRYASIPVFIQPNAGIPAVENGKTVFKVTPEEFAAAHVAYSELGAAGFGGCCGTTPAHIAALTAAVTHTRPGITADADTAAASTVCSYSRTVCIANTRRSGCFSPFGPAIVGERINPTGKKKCREALLAGDMQFVLNEAEKQIEAGAAILDVNVGLPGIPEDAVMLDAVKTIQASYDTPLQIDSSEPAVLEKALRYYNGKAMINSVNGKQKVMDAVFPIVQKYGGCIVALCLDENGIPPDADGRLAIARRIITEAGKYGISQKDIFIDALTLTISSQQKEAAETLNVISRLKQEYAGGNVKTILGVSNISFGLPHREIINAYFFSMALYAGLDACIINPLAPDMMNAYRAYRAIAAFDENCLEYIGYASRLPQPIIAGAPGTVQAAGSLQAGTPGTAQNTGAPGTGQNTGIPQTSGTQPDGTNAAPAQTDALTGKLADAIIKGHTGSSAPAVRELLDGANGNAPVAPVDIIEQHIVPALDAVGKDYEAGKKFLPQLLMSAETVSNAFAVIQERLAQTGQKTESKGSILIATVQGDIHDIGKNIVKAMLENYGYEVIDMGKDVPGEKIVEKALAEHITVIGLSALMTTTVINMEKTIRLLREAEKRPAADGSQIQFKIIAGGAVLTAEYAKKIGADFFGSNAMATVAAAKTIFGR